MRAGEYDGPNPYVPTEATFNETTRRYEITATVAADGSARITLPAPPGTIWHGKIVEPS